MKLLKFLKNLLPLGKQQKQSRSDWAQESIERMADAYEENPIKRRSMKTAKNNNYGCR